MRLNVFQLAQADKRTCPPVCPVSAEHSMSR